MATADSIDVTDSLTPTSVTADTPVPGVPLPGRNRVPFFKPPYGRPPDGAKGAADRVRDRLDTAQSRQALDRLSDRTPLSKRIVDVLGAGFLVTALSPLLLLVAALVKRDGGPIFYWQKRVGLRGREFWFPKFRSMMPNADRLVRMLNSRNDHAQAADGAKSKKGEVTFKMKDDPRVTWIGKIIRKLSIDELPQLWCVLKGEMSLVGPRPALPREVALYSPGDRRRLEVTPGLTCIWQVSGRGDIPFPQQVEMDVAYIEAQNLWLDLKLIVLTVPAVLRGRGAY